MYQIIILNGASWDRPHLKPVRKFVVGFHSMATENIYCERGSESQMDWESYTIY